MKQKILILIIITLCIKLCLLFIVNDNLSMNWDEEVNYEIATNHINGKGYTYHNPVKKEALPTAFHGSFPIFLYEFLIKSGIRKESWVIFMYALTLILFGVSILFFFKLSSLIIHNERYAFFATITYCFYPSFLYYIGTLFFYENVVTSLLIIVIYRLLSAQKTGYQKVDYFILPLAISLSCLFRPQTIAIFALILTLYLFIAIINRMYKLIPLLFLVISFTSILHIPILIKNKKLFGEYILSTQSGFEFLQGHNPYAKGSWMGKWKDPKSQFYKYAHDQIKNIDSLNEWEESKQRQKLAMKWIKENPINEILLDLTKVLIFFVPKNFEVLRAHNILNPINLLVHLSFLCLILFKCYKRDFTLDQLQLLSPIAASMALSIVFFVGYRWRYYAEPFMIIFAWQFMSLLYLHSKKDKYLTKTP